MSFVLFAFSIPASAAYTKVSSNTGGADPINIPPIPAHTSQITFDATDAMTGSDSRYIKAQGVVTGENIAMNSISLNCGGFPVGVIHNEIEVETGDDQMGKFEFISFMVDSGDVAAIAPAISTQRVWCSMSIPQASITWLYPNAFRLDEVAPNVASAGNVTTLPIVPLDGGRARFYWNFTDAQTPGDIDGECGTSACNLTDERFKYQFYYKQKTAASYPGTITASAGPEESYIDDDAELSTVDRFGLTDDSYAYCYTLRVGDTAGNYSDKAVDDEQCFIPDGRAPVLERVEFYKDAALTWEFPHDALGNYTVTTNPCFFNAGCEKDAGNPRLIYIKFVMSEPLFTGQFFGGYTMMADDGIDNDNDGDIDEETGGFDNALGDADTLVDEDVSMAGCVPVAAASGDAIDNDCDGFVDEEANGLNGVDDDGDGSVDEDYTGQICEDNGLWNRAQGKCFDATHITILGPDPEGQVPGSAPYNSIKTLKWECTAWSGNTNALCDGYDTGTTVYSYIWDVSGPLLKIGLEDGDYEVSLTRGMDGVGNSFDDFEPDWGGVATVDNTPPEISVSYFKNDTYTSGYTNYNHDNDAGTPNMPVVPEGNLYIRVTLDDYSGATPTIGIYTPDLQLPDVYEGEPQEANLVTTVTAYTTCDQAQDCDPCNGDNCVAYDPYGGSECRVFRACYDVDSASINNGYAAMTVWARDWMENMKWEPDDAHAQASRVDTDGLGDDANADSYPTYIDVATMETDAALSTGQYFAIDTYPPGAPAMGPPVRPCDGNVARQALSCDPGVPTTNSPMIKWTRLSNGTDDDDDGDTDEEFVNDADDDLDGLIDEDNAADTGETKGWEVSGWHFQICSSDTFATSSEYFYSDTALIQSQIQRVAMPERTATAPYYWRVAAYDLAGNQGPWSPVVPNSYYTFAVDITAPQFSVTYFSDSGRTTPLVKNANGLPVTSDTASLNEKVYVTLTSHEELEQRPTFKVYQAGHGTVLDTTATTGTLPGAVFFGEFEVDAKGGGQTFYDGPADFLVTAGDVYGNNATDTQAATGGQFFVDTEAPIVGSITASNNPASTNNDGDQDDGELCVPSVPLPLDWPEHTEDGVQLILTVSEDIVGPDPNDYLKIKVKQNNFPSTPTSDDGVDNDCDGVIDEEIFDYMDNDGDGRTDEDYGTSVKTGEGCLVSMKRMDEGYYMGCYNVVGEFYDGEAQIIIGSTDPTDEAYATDYAGNPIVGSGSFVVDTVPPDSPTLYTPYVDQYVKDNTPELGWSLGGGREDDLARYQILLDTEGTFDDPIIDEEVVDDGSTSFTYQIPDDIDPEEPGDQVLEDGTYYWIVYAYDLANNKSDPYPASVFHVDTATPSYPIFKNSATYTGSAGPNPAEYTSDLSGMTEPGALVEIYVNAIKIGEVTACEDGDSSCTAGEFTVGINDDKDSYTDEDEWDEEDNDDDGAIDEDPPGIFLTQEGDNVIEGRVTDLAGNVGTRGCDSNTSFYNSTKEQCIIRNDTGAPKFKVFYFSDSDLTEPLPFNPENNRYVAMAGTVYMKFLASEELAEAPKYSVYQQGSSDLTNQTATSIGGSLTEYSGSYTVNTDNGSSYLDGDAEVYVKGTDLSTPPKTTADTTQPTVGANFLIDTKGSTYEIQYFSDSKFRQHLPVDENLYPNAKEGSIYLFVIANEPQSTAPTLSIDQAGTTDVSGALTTAYKETSGTSTVKFYYKYDVNETDGSAYLDGYTTVTFDGTDIAGNTVSDLEPTTGVNFYIDTTAPSPPTLVLPSTTTLFTQMDVSGKSEGFAQVEIYLRADRDMEEEDGIDNDGDGYIDEEIDNNKDDDNDLFIDEDLTENTCDSGYFWDSATGDGRCLLTPADGPPDNGSTQATTGTCYTITNQGTCAGISGCFWDTRHCRDGGQTGSYATTMTGLFHGKNQVYVRAIDFAGNISEFSEPTEVRNIAAENVTLSNTFESGWNMVGIPMQPSVGSPTVGLDFFDNVEQEIFTPDIFHLESNGMYKTGSQMSSMKPGYCYWMKFDNSSKVSATGITSTTTTVALYEGWNMISVPYNYDVAWDENIIVKYQGDEYALGSTGAEEFVSSIIYFYTPSTGAYEEGKDVDDSVTLEPWMGFVIRAYEDCSLIFPYQ